MLDPSTMLRARAAVAAAVVGALLLGGCARCGGAQGDGPERYLPADAPVTVVVPRLRALQEGLAALLRAVGEVPAAAGAGEAVTAASAQLGFDPLDPAATAGAGLDPERGAGAALWPGRPPLLVLPVGDAGKLEALVARLARDRLGATRRAEARGAAGRTVTFAREGAPTGEAPALALLFTGRHALLGAGEPARLAAAAALAPGARVADSPAHAALRALAGEGQHLLVHVPAGSPALDRFPVARDGAVATLSSAAGRLVLRAGVLLPPARRQVWEPILAEAPGAPARFPADAFLVGRMGGDAAALARRLLDAAAGAGAGAGSPLAPLLEAGLDPRPELLPLLAPGASFSLALAPTFTVSALRSPGSVEADPFRLALLSVELRVKDPAAAAAALDRLAARHPAGAARSTGAADAAGPTGSTAMVGGGAGGGLGGERVAGSAFPTWRFAAGAGALHAVLDGPRLVLSGGGGPERAAALAGGAGPAYAAPTEDGRAALAPGGAGAVLDVESLVRSFRALPASAYGSGPDAFVMRALAERVVEPAARARALSLRVALAPGGARADLALELAYAPRPAEGGAP